MNWIHEKHEKARKGGAEGHDLFELLQLLRRSCLKIGASATKKPPDNMAVILSRGYAVRAKRYLGEAEIPKLVAAPSPASVAL